MVFLVSDGRNFPNTIVPLVKLFGIFAVEFDVEGNFPFSIFFKNVNVLGIIDYAI